MKVRNLILSVALMLSYCGAYSQYQFEPEPNPNTYDYMYVFDTSYLVNCFLSDDSLHLEVHFDWDSVEEYYAGNLYIPRYSDYYAELSYYTGLKRRFCDSTLPDVQGYVVGANCLGSEKYAEAFAQNYTLTQMNESNYVICGVAIKLNRSALDDVRHLCVLNDNFDTLSSTPFHTLSIIDPATNTRIPWNRGGWNMYYFPNTDFDSLTNLTNFKLAFDVPLYGGGNTFRATHTCNVYSPCVFDSVRANGGPFAMGYPLDTVFYGIFHPNTLYYINTYYWMHTLVEAWTELRDQGVFDSIVIPLCNKSETKYIKHGGEWIAFEDDPVYELYRDIQIAMVPIIMIPKQSGGLSEVEMDKICYLYPNPAKNYFKVLSHFDIKNIQIADMSGKIVLEKKLHDFEAVIDTRSLTPGSYVVKILTTRGCTEKKLVVQ